MKAGIGISISVGIALIPVLLATGCSQNRSLAGLWKGDRDWKSLNLDSEAVARARAAVDLELKYNGEFVLKDGGEPFTGTWSQASTGVNLQVDTYMNKPIEEMAPEARKELQIRVRLDNGHLYFSNYVGEKEFELKKESKPK